jgi:hypothetical protein
MTAKELIAYLNEFPAESPVSMYVMDYESRLFKSPTNVRPILGTDHPALTSELTDPAPQEEITQ